MPGEHAIAKTGRETFDLTFNCVRKIALGTMRRVGIGPESLSALRRTSLVEETLLRDQNKWTLRMMAAGDFAFAQSNLLQRSAKVKGSGPAAFWCPPRHRFRERVIDFEDCGSMAKKVESRVI